MTLVGKLDRTVTGSVRNPFRAVGLLLLAVSLLWPALVPGAAAGDRHALMIVDANTGQIIQSEQADAPRHPASLTKMMTLYLTFEAIERGRMTYQTKIKVSQEAASAPPTKLDLEPGEEIAAIDAIKSLITKSANDMAIALAEHLGGTEAHFAELMNAKARQLGMTHTFFRNASGLPNDEQVTTARDIVTLALHLQDDFPTHYTLFSTRMFSYGGSHYRNHNMLLGTFQGTDGIKTGYTRASGFNIVVSVHRDGKHLVGAVFGGDTASARDNTMRLALARALMHASTVKTRRPALLVAETKPAPRPVPAQQPVRVAANSQTPSWTPPAPQEPTIAIARVRPVMVTPRPKQAATDTPPLQPVGESGLRQPTLASAAINLPPNGHLGLGAAPSTLSQQASNLGRGAPPVLPAVALQPPAPVEVTRTPHAQSTAAAAPVRLASAAAPVLPAAHTAGAYEIQIGAYGSQAEAQKALDLARAKAGAIIGNHPPRTIAVTKDNRQLHRARFAGFESKTAADVCLGLRKQQIDCFVMKAE